MVDYSSTHIQNLFDVSYETVRNHTKEFAEYLSPTATPPKGETRVFHYADLEVLALVVEMKRERKTYANIHVALKSGQRGIITELTQEEIHGLALSREGVLVAQALQVAKEKIAEMEAKLKVLEKQEPVFQSEIAALKGQLELYNSQFIELIAQLKKAYADGFKDGIVFKKELNDDAS